MTTCQHRYSGTHGSAICGAPADPRTLRCAEHTTCRHIWYGTLGRSICGEPADPRTLRCAQHGKVAS